MAHAIRSLMLIGFLLNAVSSWAGIESIYGDWEGGGSGTEAVFGTMTITKTHLSWKGKARGEPRCTVRYEKIREGFGVRFRDQVGTEYVSASDSPFKTFLVRIDGRKRCALGITHFRLTLHEDRPVSMDYVEYHGLTDPSVARGHFFRKPQD